MQSIFCCCILTPNPCPKHCFFFPHPDISTLKIPIAFTSGILFFKAILFDSPKCLIKNKTNENSRALSLHMLLGRQLSFFFFFSFHEHKHFQFISWRLLSVSSVMKDSHQPVLLSHSNALLADEHSTPLTTDKACNYPNGRLIVLHEAWINTVNLNKHHALMCTLKSTKVGSRILQPNAALNSAMDQADNMCTRVYSRNQNITYENAQIILRLSKCAKYNTMAYCCLLSLTITPIVSWLLWPQLPVYNRSI